MRGGVGPTVLALALVAVACTAVNSGHDQAVQACRHVVTAIDDYRNAAGSSDVGTQSSWESRALAQLSEALPLAAHAAESDGSWQALMTTLQDVNRVPIGDLIPALSTQCSQAFGHTVGTG